MPFIIKATYRGLTRRLRPGRYGFYSWEELLHEIRVAFGESGPVGVHNVRVYDLLDVPPVILSDSTPIVDAATFDSVIRPFFSRNTRLSRSLTMKLDVIDMDSPSVPKDNSTSAMGTAGPVTDVAEASSPAVTIRDAAPQPVTDHTRQDLRNIRDIAQKFLADFAKASAPFDLDEEPVPTVSQRVHHHRTQAPPSVSAMRTPTISHPQVICDGCDNFIYENRYKCTICSNFDFCQECFTLNKSRFGTYGHPHRFELAPVPFLPARAASASTPAAAASTRSHGHSHADASDVETASFADAVVHNAYCNACFRTIRGVRNKCTRCPDYDLCDKCMQFRHHHHRDDHEFVALHEPGEVMMWAPNPEDSDAEDRPDIIPAFKTPAPPSTEPVMHNATCDVCDNQIVGIRYKCLDCEDYDLCKSCIPHRYDLHLPLHTFLSIDRSTKLIVHRVPERQAREEAEPAPVVHEAAPVAESGPTAPAAEGPSVVHAHPATCDLCENKIYGIRYKCADCPDFDTCESCFSITEDQHPGHSFIRIRNASDFINRDTRYFRHLPSHFARCNNCNEQIPAYQARYKCTHPSCPDFDLCANCEALPYPTHPVEHAMLKLRVPASMIQPKESLPQETEETNPVVHPAICDFCDCDIVGVRYKCTECDDFDLCQACESIPKSHPESHVLLKIKTLQEPRAVVPPQDDVPETQPQAQALERSLQNELSQDGPENAEPAVRVPKQMIERPSAQPVSVEARNVTFAAGSSSAAHEEPIANPFEDTESKLDGHFVEDLSIPDGHPMSPNSSFVKRWRLLNPGPHAWPARTQLRFTGGDSMGATEEVHVGTVEAGHGVVVEVAMQAASTEGKQLGFWSLACDDNLFGHRLWVEIEVVDPMDKSLIGSGSSLESSAIVMPTAPSAAGSPVALRADENNAPLITLVGQVEDEIEESSHGVSSNVSVVSLSEVSDDEWDASARVIEHGVIAEDNREIEDGWDAVADTLEREAREHSLYVDVPEDQVLRDRNGYVLVYDGYDSSDSE